VKWWQLAPVVLAGALAGCGSASSFLGSDSPTNTVRQFLEAAAARDGAAACGLLNGHGQQLMAGYPNGRGGRSCQQTVARLGSLPHSADWDEMARGTICVYGTNGADSQPIVVIYTRAGSRATSAGSVQQSLGPGFRVVTPPTPGTGQAPRPPGSPHCNRP
jgi:hypothetical protein